MSSTITYAGIVGAGGFIGALARYSLSGFVHRLLPAAEFPYGTLVVNLLGCLVIGIFAGLAEDRQLFGPEFRTFVLIGILGGFTTYSTFGYETFAMMRDAEFLSAAANVLGHVVTGLAMVWLGYGMVAWRAT